MPTDAELLEIEGSIATKLAVQSSGAQVGFTEVMQERIDDLADVLAVGINAGELAQIPEQLRHVFTPNLCVRELTLPRGSIVVTAIHLTEHPFVVSKGTVRVFIEGVGWETIKAPYIGVTKPMTRRVALVVEDCVWTTFHVTDKTDPDEIMADIAVPTFRDWKEELCLNHSLQQQTSPQ